MVSNTGVAAPSAAALAVGTAPPDDAGAQTADRYDWQAAMAAADALSLYLSSLSDGALPEANTARIICEHHEDWCAIDGPDAELVSAKHREPGKLTFTTANELATDGGLYHLFDRWKALGETPQCRLVTSGGMGAGDPQALQTLCRKLRSQPTASVALDSDEATLTERLLVAFRRQWAKGRDVARSDDEASPSLEGLVRFLSCLTIDDGRIARQHVAYGAPSMYAQPVLDSLGSTATPAEAIWNAVHGLFRTRMRAAGVGAAGALPAVLGHLPGDATDHLGEAECALISRTVTLSDIDKAIRFAIAYPAGYVSVVTHVSVTRVAVKMSTGRCGPNSVTRAEQLRLDYRRHWRDRINSDPAARRDQQELHRTLLGIVDGAASSVARADAPWGAALWTEIQTRIAGLHGARVRKGLDDELLLGGICELAARCKVWFSPPFDVALRISEIKMARVGGA